MFTAGLAANHLQKNEEQVPMGSSLVTCSLCSKFAKKRILGMAVGKHRVFPVTRHGYSSSAKEVARVPLKKTSDARCKPSKMRNAVPGGFMNTRIPATIAAVLCVLS